MVSKTLHKTYFASPNRLLNFFLLSLFMTTNFFANFWLSRFEPDIHHDGYVLAGAIAASEGLLPNRDFFTQYGPLGPLLQGFWLQLTSPTLLNLRILNALLITLNFTVAIMLVAKNWSFRFSILVVSTIAFSYTSVLPPMLPWTSVLLTSTLLFALILLRKPDHHRKSIYSPNFFFAGLVLGVGIYIRIHGLFVIMAVATFLLLQRSLIKLGSLLGGFVFTVFIATLIQWKTNSLSAFIQQVFVSPFTDYTSNGNYPLKTQIVNLFLLFSSFIYLLLLVLSIFCIKKIIVGTKESASKKAFSWLLFSVTSVLAYTLGTRIANLPVADRSFLNPQYFLYFFSNNWRHLLAYCAVAVLLLQLRNVFGDLKIRLKADKHVPFFFALGTLTQLFPTADYFHLWWITPVLVVCCAQVIPQERARMFLVPALMTSVLLANLLFFVDFVSTPRYLVTSTVAKNMYTSNLGLQTSLEAAVRNVPPGEGYFHCNHGIFAVADGKYLPTHWDFVNWGPQFPNKENRSGRHFYCDSNVDEIGSTGRVLWRDPTGTAFIILKE